MSRFGKRFRSKKNTKISFDMNNCNDFLGTDISKKEFETILKCLKAIYENKSKIFKPDLILIIKI